MSEREKKIEIDGEKKIEREKERKRENELVGLTSLETPRDTIESTR